MVTNVLLSLIASSDRDVNEVLKGINVANDEYARFGNNDAVTVVSVLPRLDGGTRFILSVTAEAVDFLSEAEGRKFLILRSALNGALMSMRA